MDNIILTLMASLFGLLWWQTNSKNKIKSDLNLEKTKNQLLAIQNEIDKNKAKQEQEDLTRKSLSDTMKKEQDKDVSNEDLAKFFNDPKPGK